MTKETRQGTESMVTLGSKASFGPPGGVEAPVGGGIPDGAEAIPGSGRGLGPGAPRAGRTDAADDGPEPSAPRGLKLRNLLFLLLLLSGIVPLAVSSFLSIRNNREILETQEKTSITRAGHFLSVELNDQLRSTRRQLAQVGRFVLATPADPEQTLRQPWLLELLQEQMRTDADLLAVRILNREGRGVWSASAGLPPELQTGLDDAFSRAMDEGKTHYLLSVLPTGNVPVAVLAEPVSGESPDTQLVVQAVIRIDRPGRLFKQAGDGDVSVFLIDRTGEILWSGPIGEEMRRAVQSSRLVRAFVTDPLAMTQEYTLPSADGTERVIGRVSPVEETGWGVVVHRPVAEAFAAAEKMVFTTVVSTAVLVGLALAVAALAARKVSQPIQMLADTTHQIAEGRFGERVEGLGPSREVRDLARDFNRMSGYVQDYVGQLRRAALANRELFIGLMRAFVAAVDAKDPYLRGHSERVATFSHTISRHLGLTDELQHRIWVGALLHDVGKIGIDDRILSKGGVLTDEEYKVMMLHPEIGADIMGRVDQLKEMIPAIRWHHEAWNGRGYPDGLKGEQIPLISRIVCLADTFDAITTDRPYQRAYTPEFAVETVTRLAGTRFDAKVVTAFLQAFEAGEVRKHFAGTTGKEAAEEQEPPEGLKTVVQV